MRVHYLGMATSRGNPWTGKVFLQLSTMKMWDL